jgi:hypothetical protein
MTPATIVTMTAAMIMPRTGAVPLPILRVAPVIRDRQQGETRKDGGGEPYSGQSR